MSSSAPHALVTGASSGIGAALARVFSAAGYRVSLVARRRDRLEALATSLPHPAHVCVADLACPDAPDLVLTDVRRAFGRVDLLINNAGVQALRYVDDLPDETAARLHTINQHVPMRLARALLPEMTARGRGAIVNIASIAALAPVPGMADYSASKAALATWSELARWELRHTGVQVLTVYPGPISTDMETRARTELVPTWTQDAIPTGQPEALAREILRALGRKRARLIYPTAYHPLWYSRWLAATVTRRMSPPLIEERHRA